MLVISLKLDWAIMAVYSTLGVGVGGPVFSCLTGIEHEYHEIENSQFLLERKKASERLFS